MLRLVVVGVVISGSVLAADKPQKRAADTKSLEVKPPGRFIALKGSRVHSSHAARNRAGRCAQIAGEVSPGMAAYMERVCAATKSGDLLLLEMNTFGGRIDSAVAIRDALLSLRERGVVTVTYINRRAISAGALIAYSTDIIAVSSGSTMGAATPVSVGQDGQMQPVAEKVVSYMRSEMRSTAEARGRNGDIAEAMVDKDRDVPGLSEKGKLLTLNGKQLLNWGIASFEVSSVSQLMGELGYGEKGRSYDLQQTPQVGPKMSRVGYLAAAFLASHDRWNDCVDGWRVQWWVVFLLALGGICLGVFFFGHLITNLAGVEDLLLFILGLVLVGVEVVAPGHIVFGVAGVVCIVASLALGLINFDHLPVAIHWEIGNVSGALARVMQSILATAVISYLAIRYLPNSRWGRRLVLSTAIEGGALDQVSSEQIELVGCTGVTATELRPAGKVEVSGKRYDAVSELDYITAGKAVRVVGQRGFSLVVRPEENNSGTPGKSS